MKLNADLDVIRKEIFEANGFEYSQASLEAESAEYSACSFTLEGRLIKYRLAKITPTKNGQFVTIWKRSFNGPIQPYDSSDEIDFVLIAVKKEGHFGLFLFPKEALIKHGVFSVNHKGGKRAIRVYPSWDKVTSKQAEKTQRWQLDFFLDISKNKSIDSTKFKSLFLF